MSWPTGGSWCDPTGNRPALKAVARRPGALDRFLEERDA